MLQSRKIKCPTSKKTLLDVPRGEKVTPQGYNQKNVSHWINKWNNPVFSTNKLQGKGV